MAVASAVLCDVAQPNVLYDSTHYLNLVGLRQHNSLSYRPVM